MAGLPQSAFAPAILQVVNEVLDGVEGGLGGRLLLCASVATLFEARALAHARLDIAAASWSVCLWCDGPEGSRTVTVSQAEFVVRTVSLTDWWQTSACRDLVLETFALPHLAELPMTSHGDVRSLLVLGRDRAFGNEDARRMGSARRTLAALERVVVRLEPPVPDGSARRPALTSREIEVLCLLSEGLLARSIASRLRVSERTVHRHLGSVYRKLDAHDRLLAVRRAQAWGLVPENAAAAGRLEPAG